MASTPDTQQSLLREARMIFVKFCLNRLPARVPDGIAFLDVKIAAIGIGGDVIVAVTRDAAELCINCADCVS